MNSILPLLITTNLTTWPSSNTECNKTNPCPLQGGRPLLRCPELVSKNGYLEIVLSVEIGYFKFDWLELPRRSYNGSKCPVTWRVKPGDTVRVTLINRLAGTDPSAAQNITNLHTHGLHISPTEPQDNVFVSVKPGESYQYTYKIIEDHPPGTYWYHAHHHGSTTLQTTGGLAGMLIVEDNPSNTPSELRAVSCPENCEHDIPLIISPMLLMYLTLLHQKDYRDSLRDNHTRISENVTFEDWLGRNVNNLTVNGEINPIITLQQDQLTRFRILNVGDVPPLELSVVDELGNPAPCGIREIARDGVYFDVPLIPKNGQSVLFPGNRLDWLIKCKESGVYKLYSRAKEINANGFAGIFRFTTVVATIHVTMRTNSLPSVNFPKSLPPRPRYMEDLRGEKPDQVITVEIGGKRSLNREFFSRKDHYRYKVEVDSVIEIQMISADYFFSHPMHFHVNHVQVVGYQPYTGPVAHYVFYHPAWEMRDQETGELCYYQHPDYKKGAFPINITDPLKYKGHYERWKNDGNDTLPYHPAGEWMDTVFSAGLSNLTLRMRVDRFTGTMLVHCHIPTDSDMGMMIAIEVVEKGGNTSGASILSGNAAPGSCKKCDWNRYREIPPECTPDTADTNERLVVYVTFATAALLLTAAIVKRKLSLR